MVRLICRRVPRNTEYAVGRGAAAARARIASARTERGSRLTTVSYFFSLPTSTFHRARASALSSHGGKRHRCGYWSEHLER
jgi:hypothetical protein